ncbi:MAG: DNA polymerase III subunit delta' [Proteobacteria bacterium]|nr:DNA polymerase III subunit delta' [Pseudomonadota bacterium]
MFDAIIDQENEIGRLIFMFKNRSIPHALLFSGIEGIGKRTIALTFAMALNCPESNQKKDSGNTSMEMASFFPCSSCRSCHKILSGVHPDILHISPSGNMIKIAQIRELCSKLLLKPYEAKTRVVIIDDAHSMNPESSNALLKSLEEPPENTMFILITNQTSDLLPTIVSRCQEIGFNPISLNGIETFLTRRGLDPERAGILASMANGSIGKALILSEKTNSSKGLFSFRKWLADEIELCKDSTSLTSGLLFAEKLSSKKDFALNALDVMISLMRDLVIYKFSPDKILNRDLEQSIARISYRFSVPDLLLMNAHIQRAQKNIQANAALRLSLEIMAFNLSRV